MSFKSLTKYSSAIFSSSSMLISDVICTAFVYRYYTKLRSVTNSYLDYLNEREKGVTILIVQIYFLV